MSELERSELYQMLSGLAAVQPIDAEVDEPDGTYYEYDRNLKATVKVTPDGERTPVAAARQPFERPQKKPAQKCPRRDDNLSRPKPTLFIIAEPLGSGKQDHPYDTSNRSI